jgi:transposase
MIQSETRALIVRLKASGLGTRAISRKLGLSRNTVRDILDPERRARKKTKEPEDTPVASGQLLDPFKGEIEALLLKDEELKKENPSARPLSTRLVLKAIRKLGYTGGRTILDEHLRRLRGPKRLITKAFRRFETDPAVEAQQDWTTYTVKISGKLQKVQLFSMILAWSRMQFLRAFLDQRLPTLLWGHVAAFHAFGGVPWRLVYDRQKAIAPIFIEGRPVLHDEFRAFKDHYGFEVFVCQCGDKERKGKVEKPFRYVEEGFLPQREFQSIEDLNRQLESWLAGQEDPGEGNLRRHGTTGEVPQERWLEEKKLLLPLPASDRVVRHVEKRLVAKDCTISVLGCLYTVPPRLVEQGRREVWISIGPEDLLVHDDKGQLVATHRLSREKGKLVIDVAAGEDARKDDGQPCLGPASPGPVKGPALRAAGSFGLRPPWGRSSRRPPNPQATHICPLLDSYSDPDASLLFVEKQHVATKIGKRCQHGDRPSSICGF